MESVDKVISTTRTLAIILSALVALILPCVYFLLGYQYQAAVLQTEVETNGVLVSQIINSSPEYWRYEQLRFEAILSGYHVLQHGEACRILDTAGTVVAQNAKRIDGPVVVRSHDLYDSGNVVGRIEIGRSLRPLGIKTLAVSFFSIVFGLTVYLALKVLPLRTLSRTLRLLHQEKTMAKEKEEKLSTITDTARDAIVMIDEDGKISFWNPAAEEMFGYSNSEAFGRELHTFIGHHKYYEEYEKGFEIFRKTGQGAAVGKTLELEAVRKGGIEFPVELSLSAIQIRDRWHAIGIMRDITGRKQAEEELRYKKTVLSILQQITPSAILLVDENAKIVSYNQQFIDLWGLPEEMVRTGIDEPVLQAVCKQMKNPEAFLAKVNFLFEHKEETSHDELQLGDGRIIDRYSSSVTGDDGRYYGRVWDFRDITELKRVAEEVRKLNEELELKVAERTRQLLDAQEELVRKEKLSILGQLAGSVGHELRNPLGVMSNAVYYLKTIMSGADETVKEYLDIIKSEINTSERIISDLLDFSRTKTTQQQSTTVNELIKQSLGKCTVPENVSLRLDIQETLPVKVDPLQMGQVFQNLITNAVQAMPEGGSLRITAQQAPPHPTLGKGGQEGGGDFIEVSVTDTGEGISHENMKKLFQPLFTTKARGVGLGLIVSKNLVEANGGKIEVESQFGKGTTFKVTFPAEP